MTGATDDGAARPSVVVVGHAARDLVLRIGELPGAGASTTVEERIERLGGKGANIAVGLRQLEPHVAPILVAVLGQDAAGDMALREAVEAGIDIRLVVRRGTTALLVDVVDDHHERRLLEHMTEESLLTVDDIRAAEDELSTADVVVLQLQQPADALLAAARSVRRGARIVLDGAIEGEARDELLALATVVRADAEEAAILGGTQVAGVDDALRAARELLAKGPSLVALSVPDAGDLLVWRDGHELFPHGDAPVVDPTGAGDAFVAGLVAGLLRGLDPQQIGQLVKAAATSTVQRLGGHPELGELDDEGEDGTTDADRTHR